MFEVIWVSTYRVSCFNSRSLRKLIRLLSFSLCQCGLLLSWTIWRLFHVQDEVVWCTKCRKNDGRSKAPASLSQDTPAKLVAMRSPKFSSAMSMMHGSVSRDVQIDNRLPFNEEALLWMHLNCPWIGKSGSLSGNAELISPWIYPSWSRRACSQ